MSSRTSADHISLAVAAPQRQINESCPNVQHGHSDDAELSARLAAIIAARDAVLEGLPGKNACPVLVKLGKLGDIRATCRLLAAAGVDGLVRILTIHRQR
eukprot:SAG31_NODE_599_length_13649_cov_9.930775_11_plen_100_part_00